MFSFASREDHLRQRAARGWTEDEDVLVCIVEIDRLREAVDAALFDAEMDDSHPLCRAKWRRVAIAMGAFDAATSA
jgi:hypothetical protein